MIRLFLDMDGVLADFDSSMLDHGVEWGDDEKFHSVMRMRSFWQNLPVMDGARELWSFSQRFPITILTAAPSKERDWYEMVADTKRQWLFDNFRLDNEHQFICCYRHEKGKYVDRSVESILVDDTESNIIDWNNNGGLGILHTDAPNSIKVLQQLTA